MMSCSEGPTALRQHTTAVRSGTAASRLEPLKRVPLAPSSTLTPVTPPLTRTLRPNSRYHQRMFTSPSLGLLGLILAEHLLGPQLIAEGRTTCAREAAATRCWGENEFLYGAGVTGVPGIRKWALQSYHRCVLSERYGLRCDGSGDPTVLRIDDSRRLSGRGLRALFARWMHAECRWARQLLALGWWG